MKIYEKIFYRFTREYKTKKAENWTKLWEYIEVKKKQFQDKKNEHRKLYNGICPNCRSDKDVVDKIQRVHGKTRGSFRGLGGGSVYGWVDTDGVNHCNSCGHQWKKAEWEIIDTDSTIWRINTALCISMKGEYRHHQDIIQELQPFYAENLRRLFVDRIEYSPIPTLDWLRKNFKSIYEKRTL